MRCWFPSAVLLGSLYPFLLNHLLRSQPTILSDTALLPSLSQQPTSTDGVGDDAVDSDETAPFGACLLLMDDNHRLIEWLAYHYYSLNLRRIIITIDPSSITESPETILKRWQSKISYEVWNDGDFMDPTKFTRKPGDSPKQIVKKHRYRQNTFYNACIRRLREQNQTWTAFVDPDEYVAINLGYNQSSDAGILPTIERSNSVAKAFMTANDVVRRSKDRNAAAAPGGSNHSLRHHFGKDCVVLPRAWYGSTENSNKTELRAMVPSFLDPRRLDTMRWRHRSTDGQTKKLGKSILDVSKLTDDHVFKSKGNAHRPLFDACPSNPYVRYDEFPIIIHHYLGSWEQYNFRNDPRNENNNERSYGVWREQGNRVVSTDDDIRPWLQGFVRQVGTEEAKRLLEGAGLPPAPS